MGSLAAQLGARPYLDANIIVYAVERYAAFAAVLEVLAADMDAGKLVSVTSALTLAEVLVKPYELGRPELVQAYENFLEPDAGLHLEPIGHAVLRRAAQLRAQTRLRLPDAIHAATALHAGCTSFLTNDRAVKSIEGLPVRLLSELATAS